MPDRLQEHAQREAAIRRRDRAPRRASGRGDVLERRLGRGARDSLDRGSGVGSTIPVPSA